MRNSQVAAAVAAALSLGAIGVASAAGPTPTSAATAVHQIYMAGSSAAANAVINYLETTLCGNANFSVFTTPTSAVGQGDFRAVSCTSAAGQPFAGSTVTVYYRPEGGSAVGVLPVFNNIGTVKTLNLNTANCVAGTLPAYSCTNIVGSANVNGTNDSWSGGVQSHNIDIGVSDLEPGVFGSTATFAGGAKHDPFGTYSSAFTGANQKAATLQGMTHTIAFQQAFGFIVNSGLGISDLPRDQIAAIFDSSLSALDWNAVTTASGGAVSATSKPIIVCNREIGSGTRAETDIFLNGIGCVQGAASLVDQAGKSPDGTVEPQDNYQTIAELDCVNANANSIGYVSIDNFAKVGAGKSFPNAVAITVSGQAASAATGASGAYGDVYEASINLNAHASGDGSTLYTSLVNAVQDGNANVGSSSQVIAIPGNNNSTTDSGVNDASTPLEVGAHGVFSSDFTRGASAGGNSCTPLTHG